MQLLLVQVVAEVAQLFLLIRLEVLAAILFFH
jgi:hypothetical protein